MIGLMNYNISRNETGKSQLAEIEKSFLKSISKRELTIEQLEQIESFLVVNANMMDQPQMYNGLDQVSLEFQTLKRSKLEIDSYTR